jgi:hypothetical protein
MISVIGAGKADETLSVEAYQVGALLAERGFGVVCGGLTGVMTAVCQGAAENGGFTMGIVPSSDASTANPYCQVVVPTSLGQGRNLLVVLAGEGAIAVGGAAGTLSEIGHALKMGKPLVSLHSWQLEGLPQADTPRQAVDMLLAMMA